MSPGNCWLQLGIRALIAKLCLIGRVCGDLLDCGRSAAGPVSAFARCGLELFACAFQPFADLAELALESFVFFAESLELAVGFFRFG